MKHILCAAALLGAAVSPLQAQTASEQSVLHDHESEIREVIAAYFWGRQNGDPSQLGDAFEMENGHFKYVRRSDDGDEVNVMTLGEFAGRFDGPLDSPNEGRIMMIDIVVDQMAFVKLELAGETRTFIDYFVLYRLDGAWQIVNKTAAVFMHEQ